jgi:hypothetical protein
MIKFIHIIRHLRNNYDSELDLDIFNYYRPKRVAELSTLVEEDDYRLFYMEKRSWTIMSVSLWLPSRPRSCVASYLGMEDGYAFFSPYDIEVKEKEYGTSWFVTRLK